MNILVTGAAGFIGSHICEKLIQSGHYVIGVDNFDPFYSRRVKEQNIEKIRSCENFSFYEGSILDRYLLCSIFESANVDTVIHLAAKAGVRSSIQFVNDYYESNLTGTICLLECMREFGVTKMLFASSSSVYGNAGKAPFSEEQVVDYPISPYASTKKSGELICHVYCHLHGFCITCLRLFTVYGPRQRPDLAIYNFIRLIEQDRPITFFGDGSTSRDYTYIDDIVSGFCCALDHLDGYRVYNLGGSNAICLNELIGTIEKSIGKKAFINFLPLQPGDVRMTCANISKAAGEIGYNPRFDLESGIKNFVEWYLEKLAISSGWEIYPGF